MATPMVSFDLVFISFQKKLLYFTFVMGNKVYDFWMVIPGQKFENYEPP